MRALVVDDSRITRGLLARILQEGGFTAVEQAGDGAEALERLDAAGPFDLVLTDVRMPRMDGLAFLRALKGRPAGENLPVVVISSLSDDAAIEAALAAGALNFVRKPFQPASVRRVLDEVRNVERLRRQQGAARVDMAGDLDRIGVVEVVQFLSASTRSGALSVESPGGGARCELDAGQVVAAWTDDGREGEAAFQALVALEGGRFAFRCGAPSGARNVTRPTSGLLLEALRCLDERALAGGGAA
ncbi:MAG: response regulator [Planctomycetota bacterium]